MFYWIHDVMWTRRSGLTIDSANENYYRFLNMQKTVAPAATCPSLASVVSEPASARSITPLAATALCVPGATASASKRVTSEQLLGQRGELYIEHEGREYRLRVTQNGKLILTA
jgi:hemin uptake protein HemP